MRNLLVFISLITTNIIFVLMYSYSRNSMTSKDEIIFVIIVLITLILHPIALDLMHRIEIHSGQSPDNHKYIERNY